MSKNDKLKTLAQDGGVSGWRELPAYKKESRQWLDRSMNIALRVLDALDERNMSQTELASAMNVSRQYVSKMLKGTENLTLETIAKLEEVLGIGIIDVSAGALVGTRFDAPESFALAMEPAIPYAKGKEEMIDIPSAASGLSVTMFFPKLYHAYYSQWK